LQSLWMAGTPAVDRHFQNFMVSALCREVVRSTQDYGGKNHWIANSRELHRIAACICTIWANCMRTTCNGRTQRTAAALHGELDGRSTHTIPSTHRCGWLFTAVRRSAQVCRPSPACHTLLVDPGMVEPEREDSLCRIEPTRQLPQSPSTNPPGSRGFSSL